MRKKLLAMILAGVTAMSMLTGCGGNANEPKKKKKRNLMWEM